MKNEALLEVNSLHVSAGEKEILHGVDLTVGRDETHVLMGPNGTGKSTLGYAVTGNPVYTVTSGSIVFDGEDITALPVNERAKRGIFLSFQNPLEVPGVTLSAFIRSALEQKTGDRLRLWDFKKRLRETMRLLSMDESYAERDLNVGFSGGEKKKAEILQMLMLEPKLAILDETDSGLDVAPRGGGGSPVPPRTARSSSSRTPRAFWRRCTSTPRTSWKTASLSKRAGPSWSRPSTKRASAA